jgi:hypothetical protein
VVQEVNGFLATKNASSVPLQVRCDLAPPEVIKSTRDEVVAGYMDEIISEFNARTRKRLENLGPFTMHLANVNVWQLLVYLSVIEPRIEVVHAPGGATIRPSFPSPLECRAHPREPLGYDGHGRTYVIAEDEFDPDCCQVFVPEYAVIRYVYPLKSFLYIDVPAQHKSLSTFLDLMGSANPDQRRAARDALSHAPSRPSCRAAPSVKVTPLQHRTDAE